MGGRDHYVENIEEKMHYTLIIITIKVTKEKETRTDAPAVSVIKQNKTHAGKMEKGGSAEKRPVTSLKLSSRSQMILLLAPLATVHCSEIQFLHFSLVITAKVLLMLQLSSFMLDSLLFSFLFLLFSSSVVWVQEYIVV